MMEDYFNCQYCAQLVSEDGAPQPQTCYICQGEIDADDKHEEEFYA